MTVTNVVILLELTAILGILSLAMLVVLIAGEIDISVTAQVEFVATIAALTSISYPDNTLITLALTIIAALAIGIINGFLVAILSIPSFLVTLATSTALLGPILVLTKYSSLPLMNATIVQIFYGIKVFGLSISIYWFIITYIIGGIMLKYTTLGREIYATGGDIRAAFYVGINTRKIKMVVFIIASILSWLAGMILVSRSLSARAYMASGYLMLCIAAPVLAGATLTGGTGSVVRTGIATFLLNSLIIGVYILGLEPALYTFFMGALLLVILALKQIKVPPQLSKVLYKVKILITGKEKR